MANDNYEADSLIEKCVRACEQNNHSLDDAQIGCLENTLNETFGIKRTMAPPKDVFKNLDMELVNDLGFHRYYSGQRRILNILNQYRKTNLGRDDNLPLTEAEAWSLYSLTEHEIEQTTYKALKEKHNLPKAYGWTAFRFLYEYFIERGVIDEGRPFRRPVDA